MTQNNIHNRLPLQVKENMIKYEENREKTCKLKNYVLNISNRVIKKKYVSKLNTETSLICACSQSKIFSTKTNSKSDMTIEVPYYNFVFFVDFLLFQFSQSLENIFIACLYI